MKMVQLKFAKEIIDDVEENIIEIYMLDYKIMKYIVREEMYVKKEVRSIEGEVPKIFKKYMGGLKNGE